MNSLLKLLGIIASAIVLAACSDGGNDGSSPSTGSSPTYSISGTVSSGDQTERPTDMRVAGVTISVSPGGAPAVTGADGTFRFTDLANNASYTVTPLLAGYTFTPASIVVLVNGANVTGIVFTATANPVISPAKYTISCKVTGGIQAGVTVSLSPGGAPVTTGADGRCAFSVTNGVYTITPSDAAGTIFNPPNATITVNGADVTVPDFTTPWPTLATGKLLYPCPSSDQRSTKMCSQDLSTGTILTISSSIYYQIVPARVGGIIAFQDRCIMTMSLTAQSSPFCAVPEWTEGVTQGSFDITKDGGITGVAALSQVFTTPGFPTRQNIILYKMDGSGFWFRVTDGSDVDTSPTIASAGDANSILTLLWVRNGTEILMQAVDLSKDGLIGTPTVFASNVMDGVRAMSVNAAYTHVVFQKNVGGMGLPHITVKPLAGGAEVDLGVGANPYWALDGSDRILFTDADSSNALWVINQDGTGEMSVPIPSNLGVGVLGILDHISPLSLTVFGPAGF